MGVLGVDVGGTFTDAVLLADGARVGDLVHVETPGGGGFGPVPNGH